MNEGRYEIKFFITYADYIEIYNKLKETLPRDEFIELQKEEISWIAQKEKDAQAAGKEYEGGTAQGLAYSSSLAKSTKDRCYELVNKYM